MPPLAADTHEKEGRWRAEKKETRRPGSGGARGEHTGGASRHVTSHEGSNGRMDRLPSRGRREREGGALLSRIPLREDADASLECRPTEECRSKLKVPMGCCGMRRRGAYPSIPTQRPLRAPVPHQSRVPSHVWSGILVALARVSVGREARSLMLKTETESTSSSSTFSSFSRCTSLQHLIFIFFAGTKTVFQRKN